MGMQVQTEHEQTGCYQCYAGLLQSRHRLREPLSLDWQVSRILDRGCCSMCDRYLLRCGVPDPLMHVHCRALHASVTPEGVHHPSVLGLDRCIFTVHLAWWHPALASMLVQASCPSSIVYLSKSHPAPSCLGQPFDSFPSLPSAPSYLRHLPNAAAGYICFWAFLQ